LKVVILNNDFRVYWKGRLHYLRQYFAQQGVDFYAIELFGKGSPYAFDNVNDKEEWWKCLFPGHSAADLTKQIIKKEIHDALDHIQPDVIIGPSIVFYAGALGLSWAKRRKKKFVMFDDAKPTQVKRNIVIQTIKDIITAQVDGFWLPSPQYDTFYKRFDKKALLFYGFCCIDNSLFKPRQPKEYNTNALICVARLVPIKNLDNLLQAWQQVERKGTGYQLQIVGNGPKEGALKQLSVDMGLKQVSFTDAVSNDELPACLGRADAFILPSLSETWGLVVNEAMAAALPVLLSRNINAAADLLKEVENGFSFDPYDTKQIEAAIIKFIELDITAKKQMGDASLRIIDTMSYEKMGVQLLSALKQLQQTPFKKPGVVAGNIIGLWHGRYNTSGWDKL
jgi:glycosyltransferase involved in cell wall biosynthesis